MLALSPLILGRPMPRLARAKALVAVRAPVNMAAAVAKVLKAAAAAKALAKAEILPAPSWRWMKAGTASSMA